MVMYWPQVSPSRRDPIEIRRSNGMLPDTSKMIVRGPACPSMASRSEPGPASFRLVTRMIFVPGISKCLPLPAGVAMP